MGNIKFEQGAVHRCPGRSRRGFRVSRHKRVQVTSTVRAAAALGTGSKQDQVVDTLFCARSAGFGVDFIICLTEHSRKIKQ